MEIVLATGNTHKTKEIKAFLGDEYQVSDLSQYSKKFEIIEDADTFEGNADIKALVVSRAVDGLVLADDSGLCVDALNGAPGIYSARYAGAEATMEQNIALLMKNMSGVPLEKRTARFICVLSLAQKGQIIERFRGECEGHIIDERRGEEGFGYDPFFIPLGFDLTFAEIPDTEKNKISHRARALLKLRSHC